MRRFLGAALAAAFLIVPARADDNDAKSILDKAINALGGEEKLGKANAFSWKAKGTINFNGNENDFNSHVTIKGLDQYRREFGNDQFNGHRRSRRQQGLAQVRRQLQRAGWRWHRQRKAHRLSPGDPDHARRAQRQRLQVRGGRRRRRSATNRRRRSR